MQTNRNFSGKELEKVLKSGELSTSETSISGMVKESAKEGFINFTPTNCKEWVEIPISLIKNAEVLRQVGCGDHSHPYVKITFENKGTGPEKIYLAILSILSNSKDNGTEEVYQNMPFGSNEYFDPNVLMGNNSLYSNSFKRNNSFFNNSFGFGGLGFGPTLPTCKLVIKQVPCGSPLPGFPPPMCPELVSCCTWPGGATNCPGEF